ncbi:hypothetical protein Bhyg_17344, partial [Pseudolycoriella hygida]
TYELAKAAQNKFDANNHCRDTPDCAGNDKTFIAEVGEASASKPYEPNEIHKFEGVAKRITKGK